MAADEAEQAVRVRQRFAAPLQVPDQETLRKEHADLREEFAQKERERRLDSTD